MRARNLKPSFFKNDDLGTLPYAARLLFQGLWCMADREGRLEDRPLRIKVEVLPYDDEDVDDLLDQLMERGFILRYQHGNARYIQVENFKKHQNPHIKEVASTIPAPDEHSASTVQEPDKHEASPAESPFLNPESPFLTADTGDALARATPSEEIPAEAHTTAELLVQAPWINDSLDDVVTAITRSFKHVPDFNPRDGPLLAEQYTRWKGYRKKPPVDWYAAWLNWIKKERNDEQNGRTQTGTTFGRTTPTGGDERFRAKADYDAGARYVAATGSNSGVADSTPAGSCGA